MHVNGKMRPVQTISGMGKIKEDDTGDKLNYDTL
jgi:hypothetical protein